MADNRPFQIYCLDKANEQRISLRAIVRQEEGENIITLNALQRIPHLAPKSGVVEQRVLGGSHTVRDVVNIQFSCDSWQQTFKQDFYVTTHGGENEQDDWDVILAQEMGASSNEHLVSPIGLPNTPKKKKAARDQDRRKEKADANKFEDQTRAADIASHRQRETEKLHRAEQSAQKAS